MIGKKLDIFDSGLASRVGPNAFMVWSAIRSQSEVPEDCWAELSIRRLATITGLSTGTVVTSIKRLLGEKMLRVVHESKGTRGNVYVARDCMDIAVGSVVVCTIVVDHAPWLDLTNTGGNAPQVAPVSESPVSIDLVPAPGMIWDPQEKMLRSALPDVKSHKPNGGANA